jgi:hypothetical protein
MFLYLDDGSGPLAVLQVCYFACRESSAINSQTILPWLLLLSQ